MSILVGHSGGVEGSIPVIPEEDNAGLLVGVHVDKLPLRVDRIRIAAAVGADRVCGNPRVAEGILAIGQLPGANPIV